MSPFWSADRPAAIKRSTRAGGGTAGIELDLPATAGVGGWTGVGAAGWRGVAWGLEGEPPNGM
ncbi:MAG TPA: hypothetical protein VEI24_01140, partial [Nitrospiria bacterium]|nr:hypothetical protein [Nitrospiria bacterium]